MKELEVLKKNKNIRFGGKWMELTIILTKNSLT